MSLLQQTGLSAPAPSILPTHSILPPPVLPVQPLFTPIPEKPSPAGSIQLGMPASHIHGCM